MMPDIKLVIRVTNDELAALRLGQCDKPNPERVKHMLLAAARSNVRNIWARIDEARAAKSKLHSGKHADIAATKVEDARTKRALKRLQAKVREGKARNNGVIKWQDLPPNEEK